MLLYALINVLDPATWSPELSQLVTAGGVEMIPYDLDLDYDYWDYRMYVPSLMQKQLRRVDGCRGHNELHHP